MKWLELTVTFLGLGRLPRAPGTWGTLGGIPMVLVFAQFGSIGYMVATLLFAVAAIVVCEMHERLSGEHDSGHVVIDEVAGFLITMTWVPLTIQSFVLGFVLFRILDVWKPFPISLVDEKVKGGLGIVADDLVAGVIANFALQVLFTNTNWLGHQLI